MFINFLYRFGVLISNKLSGDQDDVTMKLTQKMILIAISQIMIKIVSMKLSVISANQKGLQVKLCCCD